MAKKHTRIPPRLEEDLTETAGRVADAGDAGAGQASPDGAGAQADALARRTPRTGPQPGVEKPKRG